MIRALLLLLTITTLAACGFKGGLYLPKAPASSTTASEPATAK
ncbi:hypothetical protein EJO50_02305 [Iodobacter ciconiae]|uniref:Lipoprotein n=1 Tax=Iodobacter ciconiae TaxID=2496266 RepID=A0A3S8ZPL9_9NEIS|nr:hypothetical protein EJO50_02305 [Iodobacter ciconiae]